MCVRCDLYVSMESGEMFSLGEEENKIPIVKSMRESICDRSTKPPIIIKYNVQNVFATKKTNITKPAREKRICFACKLWYKLTIKARAQGARHVTRGEWHRKRRVKS